MFSWLCLLREKLSHCVIEFCYWPVLYFRQTPVPFWLFIYIFLICLLILLYMINHIIQQSNLSMFESSTPDGLAPINAIGLIVFISSIGGLSMIWGLANLIMLIKLMPQSQLTEKMQRVNEINRKIFSGAMDIFKLNSIAGAFATLIFFLLIMGGVQHFQNFDYCLAYLFGSINSVVIGLISTVICCLVKAKIVNFARFSSSDAFDAAKKFANFQTYFFVGQIILLLGLFLTNYQITHQQQLKKPEEIVRIAKCLVSFSFGSATISIGARIINSIYAKGSQLAVQTLEVYEDRLRRDYKHPALIAKALGQVVNKQISPVLDTITYIASGISLAIYAAAYNVVGTDQQGQIIFAFSLSNCYLPILSFVFSVFYNLFFNGVFGAVIRPETGEGVRTWLNIHRYITTILLIGFLSLAAYLCLPAQFYINQIGPQQIKRPYHAYLCLLFGLLDSAIVSAIAQIFTTHPFFTNSLVMSCKTGAATNIIYGLSFGYAFNVIPIIFIAVSVFFSDYFLGSYGLGLIVIGFLSLSPHYLHGILLYTSLQNSSYMTYITQNDENLITTLIDLSKTKKDYEPHLSVFQNGLVAYFGLQMIMTIVKSAQFTESTSLKSPTIFLGVLVGAMFPYLFSSNLLRSIQVTAPAIAFDLKMQIQEIPGMAHGNMDPDFVRNSSFFSFQCLLSLKRFFVVLLLGPIVLVGIAGGPSVVIGFVCGCVISGIQLGLSSGISGCGWNMIKKEIGLNNIRDDEDKPIKPGSDWDKAANVGNSVGQSFKDSLNPSIPLMIVYWGLQSFLLVPMYSSIHS